MCFFERERGYLFTGDLVYKDVLFACYPSTDPECPGVWRTSTSRPPRSMASPSRSTRAGAPWNISYELLVRVRDAFRELKAAGKLHHGGGQFDYGEFGVWV